MLQKTRGIVLHSMRYGETGMITTIYTEEFGRMSFIMQGIHGKRSAVKSNLLRQLSLLEMEVDFKHGRELQRVKEIRNILPFASIPYEIQKSTQALFIADLLHKVLREEESRPQMFNFIYHSIEMLDLIEDGVANYHLIFLIQLSRYLGFSPTNNYSESNPFFDMIAGKFTSSPPDHPWQLKNPESSILAKLLEIGFQNLTDFKPVQGSRNVFLNFIIEYYGLHLGNKLNIKSLEILRLILH